MLISHIGSGLHRIHACIHRRSGDDPYMATILAEYGDALAAASYIMDTLAEHGVATVNDLPIRLTPKVGHYQKDDAK